MTPGVDWWEYVAFDSRNTLMQMERSPDWVQFFLDRPMVEDPGKRWNYNTGCAHMLSAIVQQESGKVLSDFAAENLFAPIGIASVSWPADSKGISYGGRGIYMTARDMARFGYLYARKGAWDGRQIIPAEWVSESTQKRVAAMFGQGYAYLWWVPAFGGFAANGFRGQRIFVVPAQDLVVVITAAIDSPSMMTEPENLVSRFILPAVKSSQPLPEDRAGSAQLNDRLEAFRNPSK
jgi:CubicO group peptidase (beta-lactamase class C family)